jgi:amino acid transporter
MPSNGGPQKYLMYSYGPLVSYLYCWMNLVILQPSSAAIIAIVFGEYVCRIIYHTAFSGPSEESAQEVPRVVVKLMAMLAVALISIMHAVSLKVGTSAQIALTVAKMAALFAVAIMGIVTIGMGKQSESLTHNIFEGSSHSPGRYGLALYSGLWAFSGWAEACIVAGEMHEVERDLPKAIHISMGITTLLYLMANICRLISPLMIVITF